MEEDAAPSTSRPPRAAKRRRSPARTEGTSLPPPPPLKPAIGRSWAQVLRSYHDPRIKIEKWMDFTREDIRYRGEPTSNPHKKRKLDPLISSEDIDRAPDEETAEFWRRLPEYNELLHGGESTGEGLHQLQDLTEEEERNEFKPNQKYTFAMMARHAIIGSPHKKLTLGDIYVVLGAKYKWFRDRMDSNGKEAWKSSVRHNLSASSMFIKLDRDPLKEPGQGSFWVVNEESNGGPKKQRIRIRGKKAQQMKEAAERAASNEQLEIEPRKDSEPIEVDRNSPTIGGSGDSSPTQSRSHDKGRLPTIYHEEPESIRSGESDSHSSRSSSAQPQVQVTAKSARTQKQPKDPFRLVKYPHPGKKTSRHFAIPSPSDTNSPASLTHSQTLPSSRASTSASQGSNSTAPYKPSVFSTRFGATFAGASVAAGGLFSPQCIATGGMHAQGFVGFAAGPSSTGSTYTFTPPLNPSTYGTVPAGTFDPPTPISTHAQRVSPPVSAHLHQRIEESLDVRSTHGLQSIEGTPINPALPSMATQNNSHLMEFTPSIIPANTSFHTRSMSRDGSVTYESTPPTVGVLGPIPEMLGDGTGVPANNPPLWTATPGAQTHKPTTSLMAQKPPVADSNTTKTPSPTAPSQQSDRQRPFASLNQTQKLVFLFHHSLNANGKSAAVANKTSPFADVDYPAGSRVGWNIQDALLENGLVMHHLWTACPPPRSSANASKKPAKSRPYAGGDDDDFYSDEEDMNVSGNGGSASSGLGSDVSKIKDEEDEEDWIFAGVAERSRR